MTSVTMPTRLSTYGSSSRRSLARRMASTAVSGPIMKVTRKPMMAAHSITK